VEPIVSSETIPVNPYFVNTIFKFAMEFLFMVIVVKLAYKEYKEIRARKSRLKVLIIWSKGHGNSKAQSIKNLWVMAIHEHFISGDEPISNLIDLLQFGFSLSLCIVWLLFVRDALNAESALIDLHRPSGIVNYDDNSLDDWSIYHRAVDHVENLVRTAINRMVRIVPSKTIIILRAINNQHYLISAS
jgi:hypothetical protein